MNEKNKRRKKEINSIPVYSSQKIELRNDLYPDNEILMKVIIILFI